MATATTAPAATGTKQPQTFAELPVAAKLFVLVFILAFLSGGYYFALHMDLADQIDGAVRQHAQLEQDLVAAQNRQQEYLRLSQELADREPIDRLNKRILPERAEIAAFLQDINAMGELSGLQIRTVEPQPEEPQQLYVKVPVQLELSGHFHQFAKFFFNISQRDRAINMENISLTRAGSGRRAGPPGVRWKRPGDRRERRPPGDGPRHHVPPSRGGAPGRSGATAPAQGGHR